MEDTFKDFQNREEVIDPKIEDILRKGQRTTQDFWTTLKKLCGDSTGLGLLLDVPPEKIAGWAAKIDHSLSLLDGDQENSRVKMLKTKKR